MNTCENCLRAKEVKAAARDFNAWLATAQSATDMLADNNTELFERDDPEEAAELQFNNGVVEANLEVIERGQESLSYIDTMDCSRSLSRDCPKYVNLTFVMFRSRTDFGEIAGDEA